MVFPDTIYGAATTHTRMQSSTADDLYWSSYANPSDNVAGPSSPKIAKSLTTALSRISFSEEESAVPLHALVKNASTLSSNSKEALLVVAGRSKRLGPDTHSRELDGLMQNPEYRSVSSDVRKTLGEVSTALVSSGGSWGLLVIQAAIDY